MKFYLKLFGALALLVIILILLQEYRGSQQPSAPVATTAPAPPPLAVAPTPSSTPFQYTPAPPQLPPSVANAARQAQVILAGSQNRDGWWYVTVQGRDRNHLSDFLDNAIRNGVRDVDHNYQAYRQFLGPDNRQAFQNTFKLRF